MKISENEKITTSKKNPRKCWKNSAVYDSIFRKRKLKLTFHVEDPSSELKKRAKN